MSRAHPVLQVSLDCRDRRESLVLKETEASKETEVLQAPREQLVHRGFREILDLRERR